MQPFMALLLSCGWTLFVYRAFGWFRRRKAEHRQRLIANGYAENNPARRLRGDKYIRISTLAYVAVYLIAFTTIYNLFPRFTPAIVVVTASWVGGVFTALLPSGIVFGTVMLYGEWTHPQGDVALMMRDNQFHRPGVTLTPAGQLGSASILNAVKAGFTNPVAFLVPPRLVVEGGAR